MECLVQVIGYLGVLKVPIIVVWMGSLILSSWFPSFILLSVIFSLIVRNSKWEAHHKGNSLMMSSFLNGLTMPRIFYLRWELPSSRITSQPRFRTGLIWRLASSKLVLRLLLLIMFSITLHISIIYLLIKLCQKWNGLHYKYKYQNSGKHLSRYSKKNTQQEKCEL